MPRSLAHLATLLLALLLALPVAPQTRAQEGSASATLSLPPLHGGGGLVVLADGTPCVFVALNGPLRREVELGGANQPEPCRQAGAEISFVTTSGWELSHRFRLEPGAAIHLEHWNPEPTSLGAIPPFAGLSAVVRDLNGCHGLLAGFPSELLLIADATGTFSNCLETSEPPQALLEVVDATCPGRVHLRAIHWPLGAGAEVRIIRTDRDALEVRHTSIDEHRVLDRGIRLNCLSPGTYRVELHVGDSDHPAAPDAEPLASVTFEAIVIVASDQGEPNEAELPPPVEPQVGNATLVIPPLGEPPAPAPLDARTDTAAATRNVVAAVVASVVLALGAVAAVEAAARRRGRRAP